MEYFTNANTLWGRLNNTTSQIAAEARIVTNAPSKSLRFVIKKSIPVTIGDINISGQANPVLRNRFLK